MSPAEILRAAKVKIAQPENWTKGSFAREANGNPAQTISGPEVVCWCAFGALVVSCADARANLSPVVEYFGRAVDPIRIAAFNDASTHAEVMQAFDRAIGIAENHA